MSETKDEQLLALREEMSRKAAILEVLFDDNPDGIAIASPTGQLEMNEVAKAILGMGGEGGSSTATWAAEFGIFGRDGKTPAPENELPLVRALHGETVRDQLLFIRNPFRPQGVWISVSAKPLKTGGALAVFRDVSDRKKLEDDLSEGNAQLAKRAAENSELVERLRVAIDELSTPVLEVWEDVLATPIVGVMDTERSARVSERLLDEVVKRRARFVILDLTGVSVVDTATAHQFVKLAAAVRLLGAQCIVTGIQPAVAHALVQLGVELHGFTTRATLRRAIEGCMQLSIGVGEASLRDERQQRLPTGAALQERSV